jgi:hypothetical protein
MERGKLKKRKLTRDKLAFGQLTNPWTSQMQYISASYLNAVFNIFGLKMYKK